MENSNNHNNAIPTSNAIPHFNPSFEFDFQLLSHGLFSTSPQNDTTRGQSNPNTLFVFLLISLEFSRENKMEELGGHDSTFDELRFNYGLDQTKISLGGQRRGWVKHDEVGLNF
ncbi:hypothetical protein Droror1_Dr00020668 [Drosera rotundifolia]